MLTALYHLVNKDATRAKLPAEQIKESYLYNKFAERVGGEENRIKLRTVTMDNEIFEKIFVEAELTDAQKPAVYTLHTTIFMNSSKIRQIWIAILVF